MQKAHPVVVAARGGYTDWTAVAGFFDGDGSVDIDVRAYTIHWVISFSDNWLGQIEQIREFLVKHGIRVGKTRRAGVGGWTCEVKEISSLKTMAIEMLRSGGIYKKKRELLLLIDYYSDKVRGTEVLEAFNTEVRLGIRVGKIRKTGLPYTHTGGVKGVTGKSLAQKYDISEANGFEIAQAVRYC